MNAWSLLAKLEGLPPVTPVHGELLIRDTTPGDSRLCYDEQMRDLVFLFIHLIATFAWVRAASVLWSPSPFSSSNSS